MTGSDIKTNRLVKPFPSGLDLLLREFEIEDQIQRATDSLLKEGKLGERGKKIYTELGSALSLFLQAASCAWGCRGRPPRRKLDQATSQLFISLCQACAPRLV
jgi:hypothetical protein